MTLSGIEYKDMNEYAFEELQIGMECKFKHKFTTESMMKFSEISGDINPLHMNQDFAIKHGFAGRVVFGMLTASLLSTIGGDIYQEKIA